MKHIYDNDLARTHVLHVHNVDYSVNAAVLHAALPNIPVDKWEETFSAVSSDLIKDILCFLYTFEVSVSKSRIKEILRASNVLQLSHLQKACEPFVIYNLRPHNYIGWRQFSEEENFHNLVRVCKERISKELNLVNQCKEFQELSFAETCDLMKEQVVDHADILFHAIMSWVLVDEDRYMYVEELIDLIDLTKCSRACLKGATVEPYDKVFQTMSLQKKLVQALLSDTYPCEANEDIKYVPGEANANIEHEQTLNYMDNRIADFGKSIIVAFKNFQMNSTHPDMTLKLSDGNTIKAHQVVLAAHSPYFEAVIRRSVDKQTKQTSRHIDTDILQLDPVAVRVLVEYIYSNKIEIGHTELLDYIHGCDFLQLRILLRQCKNYAKTSIVISQENCFEWFTGSKLFHLTKTMNRAAEFICKNFEQVHTMEGLLNLGLDDMLGVLNNSAFGSVPEHVLYETIIFWIIHNQSERGHLTEFLKSNAMKRCSADIKLDMHAILRGKNLDVNETHQIWEAHYAKLAEKCTGAQEEWNTKHFQVGVENGKLKSRLSGLEDKLKSEQQKWNTKHLQVTGENGKLKSRLSILEDKLKSEQQQWNTMHSQVTSENTQLKLHLSQVEYSFGLAQQVIVGLCSQLSQHGIQPNC